MLLALLLFVAPPLAPEAFGGPPPPFAMPGEEPVKPYGASPRNAEASPFPGSAMARSFHGQAGIRRIVEGTVKRAYDDPVIGEIFKGHDRTRLTRTLFEQFCFIINAGCSYTGRDMIASHRDLGVQQADMNRLVELLQQAMKEERVPFAAQNRLLSKLAPMRGHIVQR